MRTKPRLLQTQAFRIVLVYVVLFAFSVTALLFFTYWNTRRTLDAQTDQIIEAEITGLNEEYQHFGLQGLAETVRARTLHQGQSLYMLSDSAHHMIAGNLDSWPQISGSPGDMVEFDYERPVDGKLESRRARGRVYAVPGDVLLLVAQDVHDRYLTERMFTTTLPWTVILILILIMWVSNQVVGAPGRRFGFVRQAIGEISRRRGSVGSFGRESSS